MFSLSQIWSVPRYSHSEPPTRYDLVLVRRTDGHRRQVVRFGALGFQALTLEHYVNQRTQNGGELHNLPSALNPVIHPLTLAEAPLAAIMLDNTLPRPIQLHQRRLDKVHHCSGGGLAQQASKHVTYDTEHGFGLLG